MAMAPMSEPRTLTEAAPPWSQWTAAFIQSGYEPIGEIVGIERLSELLPEYRFTMGYDGRWWWRRHGDGAV